MTRPDRPPRLSLAYRMRDRDGSIGDPPPLLLLLHGRGGNELGMAALAGAFDARCIVISPRAPIEIEAFAFQWFRETFTPDGPRVEHADLDAASRTMTRFVDEAVAAHGANARRVYLAGFSQGGTLALATLLGAPARFAAVVAMSGWLPSATADAAASRTGLQGKHVLIVHGRSDATIGARYGREAHAKLLELGLSAEYREPDIGHTTTPDTIADAAAWLSTRLDDAETGP